MIRNLFLCLMAIIVIGGCSDTSNLITPNQIDTILSTCDTDIDIDIANGNYTGNFDINKACVDNVLLTTNPVDDTTEPVTTKGSLVRKVSVDQLVSDTKNGKTSYQGKLVFLTANVRRNSDNERLYLSTTDNTVSFSIDAPGDIFDGTFEKNYIAGQTYDFVLYIREQETPNLTDQFTFNDNSWYIRSYLVEDGDNIRNITMDQLVSDTKQDQKTYEGSVVSFNAEIRFVLTSGTITLTTNDDNVSFFVSSPGGISDRTFEKNYIEGQTYDFILYIQEQEQPDATDGSWDIWSYIVE
ncbi:hypothetical protein F4009_13190 [Candidatus Poribacteria bacterium]|nr:hypothetical protein [Candidatus Poribacteria bacterium]MYK94929.1 hypothetical protein [Candidatus Poribacteria bacterium]